MNDSKTCIECGRDLFGRSDKKYCSDACRSAYNNRGISGSDKFLRKVNRKLKRNRNILSALNPDGKVKTHQDKLIREGFDFDFFTSVYTTRDQREYRFCYEQGYLRLDNGYVLLVKRDLSE